jgi:hypothetical protein
MMKRFLLVSALTCASIGAAASTATASQSLLVTGAGASKASGQVVVHARATQPLVGSGVPGVLPPSQSVPVVGFLRAPDARSPGGAGSFNFNGRVTCVVDWLGPAAAAASGTLDTPLVSNGVTYAGFTLTVRDFGTVEYIEVWPNRLSDPFFGSMCGIEFFFIYPGGFFDPELDQLRQTLLVERGHFIIHGPFNSADR